MPTIPEQKTAALQQMRLYCQPSIEPKLDDPGDLEALLDARKRADIWAASTAYSYGQVILPTVRNGHRYRCVQAGTSGATEPTWLKSQGAEQSDGASSPALTWEEAGPDFDNVYDVRAAIHAAWMLKAMKASLSVDISQQVGGIRASQIYDHCIQMAQKFAPVSIA